MAINGTEKNKEQKIIIEYTYDYAGHITKEIYTGVDGSQKVTETEYVSVYIPYELSKSAKSLIDDLNNITWADDVQ